MASDWIGLLSMLIGSYDGYVNTYQGIDSHKYQESSYIKIYIQSLPVNNSMIDTFIKYHK